MREHRQKYLILFFIFLWLNFTPFLLASEIDLNIISKIESNHNPIAYNHKSRARGQYQITEIVLKEYNQFNKCSYTIFDLFRPEINRKIAQWYLERRIPQLLRHYNKSLTVENILICYNAGIKRLLENKIPRETKNYILKYRKETKK